ncbi:MAG: hypothetical protein WCW25_02355 [Patescibacteria group bacterium]|jgi:hypothetical protein
MSDQKINELEKRILELEKKVFNTKKQQHFNTDNELIKFDLNPRAYISRYASDKSGPKKFVLMVAFLAKGDIEKDISMTDIKSLWAKMSTKKLLGNYNDFYPNEAKTKGWVDTHEYGMYQLTEEWENILK